MCDVFRFGSMHLLGAISVFDMFQTALRLLDICLSNGLSATAGYEREKNKYQKYNIII